jgi:acetyl esterase/lipase
VPKLIIGEIKQLAAACDVEPVRIPGYWLDEDGLDIPMGRAPHLPGEKVAYYIHGGGYVIGSAFPHDLSGKYIHRGLLEYCKDIRRTFSVEYRLSVGEPLRPANPFPTALVDALAGYNYLVDVVGFDPADIILVGDSAGGNLSLALVRYLVECQKAGETEVPPPPGNLLLFSPRSDISDSHNTPGSSALINGSSDIIPDPRFGAIDYARKAYLGPHGLAFAESSPYMSPAGLSPAIEQTVSFAGFPRTLVVSGGGERILDQIRVLVKRMERDLAEGIVKYWEAPDAVHCFVLLPFWEPVRGETFRIIAEWLA